MLGLKFAFKKKYIYINFFLYFVHEMKLNWNETILDEDEEKLKHMKRRTKMVFEMRVK